MTPLFEDVLRALLVGTDVAGTRVFLMRAPQAPAVQLKTPYLVFFSVGVTPRHSQRGALTLHDREYQVSIFDPSQSRALAIAETLRQKLDGLRGDYAGIRFGHLLLRSQTATYELDTNVYHVIVTFRIQFEFLPEFGNFTIHPRKPIANQRSKTL